MSWSFYAAGKPAAVAKKASEDLARCKCSEPEETIKGKVSEIIGTCLAAFPDASAVQIKAQGSQTRDPATDKATNTLSLEISPIYGFVE